MVAELHALTVAERGRLVEALATLPERAWQAPSLCDGWDVRATVAHLLMPYELSAIGLAVGVARSGMRFNHFADRWARADSRTPGELLDRLSGVDETGFGAPGTPKSAALSHLVIHTGDILRPLGLTHHVEPDAARAVLDELARRPRAVGRAIFTQHTYRATDLDWEYGDGPVVSGPAAAIIMALLGRDSINDELVAGA